LDGQGVHVGPVLRGYRGLLTGVPVPLDQGKTEESDR
jgi:hypothetical protein